MAKKIEKTNAARLLDRAGIAYELIPYEVDENDLAATHVAESLGEPIERVYKTLVLRGDRNGHFVCVVQGRQGGRFEGGGEGVGQQECRPDTDEGVAADNGIYPRRMFADRYEAAFPDIHRLVVRGVRLYLYKCGCPRLAVAHRPERFGALRRCRTGGGGALR